MNRKVSTKAPISSHFIPWKQTSSRLKEYDVLDMVFEDPSRISLLGFESWHQTWCQGQIQITGGNAMETWQPFLL